MAKRIALSGKRGAGRYALVDDADFDWLCKYRWHFAARPNKSNPAAGYAARGTFRGGVQRLHLMHREILGLVGKEQADHIDGDGLNNTRANLRIATGFENARNRGKRAGRLGKIPTSSFKGVYYCAGPGRRKRWVASIVAERKEITLGYFWTEEEAARAYDEAAQQLHGPFASLNFPSQVFD